MTKEDEVFLRREFDRKILNGITIIPQMLEAIKNIEKELTNMNSNYEKRFKNIEINHSELDKKFNRITYLVLGGLGLITFILNYGEKILKLITK